MRKGGEEEGAHGHCLVGVPVSVDADIGDVLAGLVNGPVGERGLISSSASSEGVRGVLTRGARARHTGQRGDGQTTPRRNKHKGLGTNLSTGQLDQVLLAIDDRERPVRVPLSNVWGARTKNGSATNQVFTKGTSHSPPVCSQPSGVMASVVRSSRPSEAQERSQLPPAPTHPVEKNSQYPVVIEGPRIQTSAYQYSNQFSA